MKWADASLDTSGDPAAWHSHRHLVISRECAPRMVYYPDTCRHDSHTPMVNASAWSPGAGRHRGEAGCWPPTTFHATWSGVPLKQARGGVTATDLVLTVRAYAQDNVVNNRRVLRRRHGQPHRARPRAPSHMRPTTADHGSSRSTTPPSLLRRHGPHPEEIDALKSYFKAQHVTAHQERAIDYSQVVELDLASVTPRSAAPAPADAPRSQSERNSPSFFRSPPPRKASRRTAD